MYKVTKNFPFRSLHPDRLGLSLRLIVGVDDGAIDTLGVLLERTDGATDGTADSNAVGSMLDSKVGVLDGRRDGVSEREGTADDMTLGHSIVVSESGLFQRTLLPCHTGR